MIRQIKLVVLIPHAIMKWSKSQEKMTEKGKFSPHASPISDCSPCRDIGCLLALAGRLKPRYGSPFWRCLQSVWGTGKPKSGAQCSLHAGRVIHSHRHMVRVGKAKQKTCVLRKQRGWALRILTLSWRSRTSPQDDCLPRMMSDSWSPKKKIELQNQGPGLIT